MEFDVLMDIYQLDSPRGGISLGLLAFLGILLVLSYRYQRLGWLYRKFPFMMPLLQMFFITLVGIEVAIFFANLWADKLLISEGFAMLLTVLSIVIVRLYLSYWYWKYPISYKVQKM